MSLLRYLLKLNDQIACVLHRLLHVHFWTALLILLIGFIFIHIELIISRDFAPETLLLKVSDSSGYSERNKIQCFANVQTSSNAGYKRTLHPLDSVYDYLDSATFTVSSESGYYILNTGLHKYYKNYQIYIICYSASNRIILEKNFNKKNQAGCFSQQGGRLLIC